MHTVTRAYYQILLEAGGNYEYKPGFMHAKTFAADDEYAVVGSINLDYGASTCISNPLSDISFKLYSGYKKIF